MAQGTEGNAREASTTEAHRVLAVKIETNWKDEESKRLFNRLRDLSWQAAHFRNHMIRSKWAEATGYRVNPEANDKTDISKQTRKEQKKELSGAAYACAEREVDAVWTRDRKFILAGRPLPEWKPTSSLSIRGNAHDRKKSGVRLELENDQYVAYLSAQSDKCEGGCWLRVPIAKNTRRDEHQGDVLNGMVSWAIPIEKATVEVRQREITLRLTYTQTRLLPPPGERVATLGPMMANGRLLLRTETQTKDFTSEMSLLLKRKDEWDLIRRRVLAQISRRKGQARDKRERLSRMSWDDWLHTHLHTWSRRIAEWCNSQHCGTICVESLGTGDWPAHKFIQMLSYKAQDLGMRVIDGANLQDEGTQRAVKSVIARSARKVKRRREAVRELAHQIRGN